MKNQRRGMKEVNDDTFFARNDVFDVLCFVIV